MYFLSVSALVEQLHWLNDCLVDRRLLLQACRDKVWAQFHEGLTQHIGAVTTVCGNHRPTASFVCLQVMKTLMEANYSSGEQLTPSPVAMTDRDDEIVEYITGYLLMKLKHTLEAQALTTDVISGGLIALKNRGGLTTPTPDLVQRTLEIERVFRNLPSLDRDMFLATLCDNNVQSSFFTLLDFVDTSAESKEVFYMDFCNLFFMVRTHHKCRHMVDQHIRATKGMRKSKALRDSL